MRRAAQRGTQALRGVGGAASDAVADACRLKSSPNAVPRSAGSWSTTARLRQRAYQGAAGASLFMAAGSSWEWQGVPAVSAAPAPRCARNSAVAVCQFTPGRNALPQAYTFGPATCLALPALPSPLPAASGTCEAFAAIDFGTSNSAIALPRAGAPGGVRLVPLEDGQPTMPTALFYCADGQRLYGRAALSAYVAGTDGRLMRSMKSILGSDLLEQATDVGAGRAVRYRDVVAGYLLELRRRALAQLPPGAVLRRVVLGRPVYFVDEDPTRDARAQAALEDAARAVGFEEVLFQYEPIAAALDHESRVAAEQLVLVADIGGGTSDFALVRVGPRCAAGAAGADRKKASGRGGDRRDDILASHGVHKAGTDFDRHLELAAILPLLGYGARRPPRPGEDAALAPVVPSGIYFDLATWHLINTVYAPQRIAELRRMKAWYADARHHARLLTVLQERLGHALAAAAEAAKIEVAQITGPAGATAIDLSLVEPRLAAMLSPAQAAQAIEADLAAIAQAAVETVRRAGLAPAAVDTLYFTGGSTGLTALVDRIAAAFPRAQRVRGERYASVAQGLGLHARAVFQPGG